MKPKFTPRAMQERALMARRVLKRTRTLTRPTEALAMMRANAAHLLQRYRQTHAIADLEAYVAWAGEGSLFDDDLPVTPIPDEERPALRKGCARCARRLPDEEFIEWADDNGREVPLRHFWCSECRQAFATLRWQDVLNEDPLANTDPRSSETTDMRRGAKTGKRAVRE